MFGDLYTLTYNNIMSISRKSDNIFINIGFLILDNTKYYLDRNNYNIILYQLFSDRWYR